MDNNLEFTLETIGRLTEEIERLKNPWIKIDPNDPNTLPKEDGRRYLVCETDNKYPVHEALFWNKTFVYFGDTVAATHWMPLPASPEV